VRREIRALAAYVPGEQPRDREYIKLNTNENPYPPAPRVLEVVRAQASADLRLYPDPVAERLRGRAARVYGVPPERILVGNGSDDLLGIVMRACVGPGDRVAYPVPTYSLYDTLVAGSGGVAVRVPFGPDFSLPPDLAGAHAKLTLLCHPNSPSGTATPIDQIEALSREVSGVLVVDEAYVDFAEHSALELTRRWPNVIVLRTFSKSFSLAGLRVGLAFGPEQIMREFAKVKDSYNVGRVGMAAAAAALEEYEWMRRNVRRICSTRSRLTGALCELGYDVLPSQANFVLARRRGCDQRATYEALKSQGVLVRYFPTAELFDALRITVGTDDEVDRLLAALRAGIPSGNT